ncbi:hypothetical protein J7W19_09240 [Streptomyces mobaraensis NBRC 13819 = DSM 40847]|uniref:Uncharacterized protein n=2 Tax=Streptomyces mobaraensis TaxID=35621 RepID=A0A5N5WDG2_STRMB|nr:hypothetical protein [Streptomyces mobaraensis]EMF02338.1 hypothetical protein H340_02519 [Streptomyces mobaraensis NBRC 13819 = DSM 40847]KAB7849256.1 hypothetical protein FRZ00_07515 [Streptomyces mobaraensis]QTT73587.1 hypothetical protein J7W19_09240 [Streptomyces mobaraensis NBRC 13819 = DSM 40847]
MGTAIGVPPAVADPRITAAVFGLFRADSLAEPARDLTIPIEFVMQRDDERVPCESALTLFDAFGSRDKTQRANAGRHKEVTRFEADSAVRFLARPGRGRGVAGAGGGVR